MKKLIYCLIIFGLLVLSGCNTLTQNLDGTCEKYDISELRCKDNFIICKPIYDTNNQFEKCVPRTA